MRLFVDTSAWIALRDERDANHQKAREGWEAIVSARVSLISSRSVFGETLTLLRRRTNHRAAVEFGSAFHSSQRLVRVEEDAALFEQAWLIFRSRRELVLSYVDCLSFATMERLRLRQAFAFDSDFKAMGYVLFPEVPLL